MSILQIKYERMNKCDRAYLFDRVAFRRQSSKITMIDRSSNTKIVGFHSSTQPTRRTNRLPPVGYANESVSNLFKQI
jgi:hypothetical protein